MRRGKGKWAAWLATSLVAALCCAPAAPAAIYWGDSDIGAANLDGSNPSSKYFRFHYPMGPIHDVAVSDSHLYWGEWFGIWRVNFEGPATPVQIVPGLSGQGGIAIDGSQLYWANSGGNAISKAALDGSGRNDNFIAGLDRPCEVAVDGSYVYWIDWRGVGRARLDGTEAEESFIPTAPGGCGLAVDGGYVYWAADQGAIGRARLDGTEADHAFIPASGGSVGSIAVAAGQIYWTDRPNAMAYASIDRATLGLAPIRDWIVPPVFNIGGVAVDARPSPPPLPLPSRPIYFGKARHDKRVGSVVIDVWVPERGDLSLLAPKLGWKVLKGPEPPPGHGGSFRWRLKVWPGTSAKGRKIRTQLRNKGRAKVTLRVSYAEENQLPLTAKKQITLRKKRHL